MVHLKSIIAKYFLGKINIPNQNILIPSKVCTIQPSANTNLQNDRQYFKSLIAPCLGFVDLLFLVASFLTEEMTLTADPKIKHTMGVIKLQNHGMAWEEKDLKNHVVPASLPWAGILSTRPGCPKPSSTRP